MIPYNQRSKVNKDIPGKTQESKNESAVNKKVPQDHIGTTISSLDPASQSDDVTKDQGFEEQIGKELQTECVDGLMAISKQNDENDVSMDNLGPLKMEETMTSLDENVQCFMFDNFGTEVLVERKGKNVTCISCLKSFGRIDLHLKKSLKCAEAIEVHNFMNAYKAQMKEISKIQKNIRIKRFREKKRAENPSLYKQKETLTKQKFRDTVKKDNPDEYRNKEKLQKQRFRNRVCQEDINKYREKLRSQVQKLRIEKRSENESMYRENLKQQVAKSRKKEQEKNGFLFKKNQKIQKRNNRLSRKNINKSRCGRIQRLMNFKRAVKYGAIFVCSSCHQRMFENGVSAITEQFREDVEKKKIGLFNECIPDELVLHIHGKKSAAYLCHTCKNTMRRGKVPCMSVTNGLCLSDITDPDTKLTEVENNLIAQNIIFQKIFLLPKSRMSAVKDKLVNVPVGPSDVLNTVTLLPRTPSEAGLIQVKFKRKLKYKNYHKFEYIDPTKIFKTLEHLKKSGHPYYQFYDDREAYRKRCEIDYRRRNFSHDTKTPEMIINVEYVADENIVSIDDVKTKLDAVNDDMTNNVGSRWEDNELDAEDQYVRNDAVRRFQFDHNLSTCLTNKFPEMLVNDDGEEIQEAEDFTIAPGEGKVPTNILADNDWDIKAWPSLHPDGKFGLNHKRKLKLSDQKYFVQRIRNKDRRFEENPGYVFAAASYVEKKRLQDNANISFSRGKKMNSSDGDAVYTLNDPYTVFDNLKNTPKYWQKFRYEMIAKLENLGPFQWFFTLSCADMKWEENFTSLLREADVQIEYDVTGYDGKSRTIVKFCKDGVEQELELEVYLKNEVDESLHELIRTNVLNATRNFQHRVDAFIKNIIFGDNNPMCIKHLSYKVEFQGRGAGHIHGVLWADLAKIQKGKDENLPEFNHLTDAFKKLRENVPLDDCEIKELEYYVDKFVTCSLNPDKLKQMGCTDGVTLATLAEEVQQHRHTRTCHKYDNTCRFHKPTFPVMKTTIFGSTCKCCSNSETQRKGNPLILTRVKELLDDKETIDKIMSKYNKREESKEEYETNRSKRIKALLTIAGTNYEEYIDELRHSVKHGYAILLERDIDEAYINAFNPEWLEAWGGNIDLQACFDYFAVITYVTDYLTKDDSGVTAILREVMKKTEQDETKQRMRMLINTFLTHRQMGQAEAYYKLIPSLHMKYSTVKTVFIPTDKKESRSRFLQRLVPNEETYDKVAFTVDGREGMFIEKSDLIDKYIRRPGPGNAYAEYKEGDPDLDDLVCIHFSKMFETKQKNQTDDEQELVDEEELDFDENDIKFHYIIGADQTKKDRLLPNFLKLLPKYPGENNTMRKRRFPAAVRYHKKRKDVDTHKFFLSELMLYHPFRDEKTDLHSDNEELCAMLYMKEFDNIQKVKEQVMEHLENVEEARHMVEEYLKK